jgi:hypothetical protein
MPFVLHSVSVTSPIVPYLLSLCIVFRWFYIFCPPFVLSTSQIMCDRRCAGTGTIKSPMCVDCASRRCETRRWKTNRFFVNTVLICNQIIAGVSELEPQAFHAVFARHCFERHTFARHDFRQLTFERYTFAWQAAHLVLFYFILFYFILFYLAQPSSHCAWVPWAFMVVPQVLRSVVCLACSRLEHYQALHAEETKKKRIINRSEIRSQVITISMVRRGEY